MKSILLTAKRYAEAFFLTALKDEELFEDCIGDFNIFTNLFAKKGDLYDLLIHPLIHPEKKVALVYKLFDDGNVMARNFICVLIRRRKITLLTEVSLEVKRLYRQKKGIRGVMVKSAIPLTEEEHAELSNILEKKFGKISLRVIVDKNIVGGLIISFGNQVVDDSLRTRLRRMKDIMDKVDEAWLRALSEQPSLAF